MLEFMKQLRQVTIGIAHPPTPSLFWSQGELQCRFHLGSSMSPWAWWADPIWWRLPSSSAGQVWDVHTQLWPRSVVDRNCTLLLNLARRCWIGLVLFPFCSYYWLRLRLLRKWPRCTQERRTNWNSSKSLGTASILCLVSSDGLNLISTNLVARKCY